MLLGSPQSVSFLAVPISLANVFHCVTHLILTSGTDGSHEPPRSALCSCHVADCKTAEGSIDLENARQNSEACFQMKQQHN